MTSLAARLSLLVALVSAVACARVKMPPPDARVGDRRPDALPFAIRGIYLQERAR